MAEEKLEILEDGFEDLLGTGAVAKKTIREPPEGAASPEFGQEVLVRYNGMLLNSGESFAAGEEKRFRVGMGDVIPALELAVRLMKVGEVVEVNTDARFAYGETGDPERGIPQNAPLKFTVELVSLGEEGKTPAEMTMGESLRLARDKKKIGNEWFGRNDFSRAVTHYKAGLDVLKNWDEEEAVEEEQKTERKEILIDLANNLAAAYMKQERYKDAREACISVLEVDLNNVKALLRAAKCSRLMDDFPEASAALEKALTVDPGNKDVLQEQQRLRERKKYIADKEKQMWGKILGAPQAEGKKKETEEEDIGGTGLRRRKGEKETASSTASAVSTSVDSAAEDKDKKPSVPPPPRPEIRRDPEPGQGWWILGTILIIFLLQGVVIHYVTRGLPETLEEETGSLASSSNSST